MRSRRHRQRALRCSGGRAGRAAPQGTDPARRAGAAGPGQGHPRKKVAPFAANLALAAYQRRLAEQLGIEPGAELKAAATEARGARPVAAADRPRRGHHLPSHPAGPELVGPRQADRRRGRRPVRPRGCVRSRHRAAEGRRHAGVQLRRVRPRNADAVRHPDRRARPLHGGASCASAGDGAKHVLAVVGAGHLKGMAKYLRRRAARPAGADRGTAAAPAEAQHPMDHPHPDGADLRRHRLGLLPRRPRRWAATCCCNGWPGPAGWRRWARCWRAGTC